MQSHTEIVVAITCQAFSHHPSSLQEGFPLSFKFRHTCIHAHGYQLLRCIHAQGWVDGTVIHLLSFLVSLFCPGNYPTAQGTTCTSGQRALEQAAVPDLQHLSFPACPVPPPPHSSAPRVLQVGVFTSLPSPHSQINARKLGYFGYRNTAIKSNAKCQIW